MTKYLLGKHYWILGKNNPKYCIDRITIDFKSQYAWIEQGEHRLIRLNYKALEKLRNLLNERKKQSRIRKDMRDE